ncbi:ATP-binding protein [Streptomyces sp. NPDC096310]|uniref:ATP-binding protein n=1 Tax=Streptomyces sp. NPDC096310 TaxID=3366082 RepID=UPI00380D0F0B
MSRIASFERYQRERVNQKAKDAALAGFALALSRTACRDGMAPGDAWKPRQARQCLCGRLVQWELPHLVEPVGLLVSELVTNGFRYGAGTTVAVSLRLAEGAEGDVLRLTVWDGSPQCPQICLPGLSAEGGRGLLIVEAVVTEWCGEWGVSPDCAMTWCLLPVAGAA